MDFAYYPENQTIDFIAMNNEKWSKFNLDLNTKEIQKITTVDDEKLLSGQSNIITYTNQQIINKKGSLYLTYKNEEKVLKKFYGIYDSKFSPGYVPVKISPDGKYLIYYYTGHLTSIGTIVKGFLQQFLGNYNYGNYYIMDLETRKVDKYEYFYKMQWVE